MTTRGTEGVCIGDAINEAAATAAVTAGVFERSRGRGPVRSTFGSDSPRNSSSFGLVGCGLIVRGLTGGDAAVGGAAAGDSGVPLIQAGVGIGALAALAAVTAAVSAAMATCSSSSAMRDRAACAVAWPGPN